MYTVEINEKKFLIKDIKNKFSLGSVNDKNYEIEIIDNNLLQISFLRDNKKYNVSILKFNPDDKSYILKVNNRRVKTKLFDEIDEFIKISGFVKKDKRKNKELVAPMPGKIIDIPVQKGLEVKKGEVLIILEAMKMENNIKASEDCIISKIHCTKEQAVEKQELLMEFE